MYSEEKMATTVTTTTLREDLGLLDRAGHPVTAALTRYIAKGVILVDKYKASASQTAKDLVINDLCANQTQNWFTNQDTKSKGPRKYAPTWLTQTMKDNLDEDFVADSTPKDDGDL